MNIKTGKGSISLAMLLAVWSVSAIASLPGLAVSPILGDLNTIFPKASDFEIQLLASAPALLIIPFVLLAGRLSVGRDKTRLLLTGLSIFLASGIACFVCKSIGQLIAASAILGIGAGIVIPFSTGLVVDIFVGRQRIQQLGLSSAINNMTLVLATAATGYLAGIDWHLPFLVYTLPAISIVLIVSVRNSLAKAVHVECPLPRKPDSGSRRAAIDKPKLARLMALYLLITCAVLSITFYLSFLIDDYKLDHSISGLLIALFFLAIMLPGLILPKLSEFLGCNLNFVSLIMVVCGLALIGTFRSETAMTAGVILSGLGYGIMQPIIYAKCASTTPPRSATLALAFIMASNYLAILIAPVVTDLLRDMFATHSNRFPFLFSAAITAATAAYAFFRRDGFTFGLDRSVYS